MAAGRWRRRELLGTLAAAALGAARAQNAGYPSRPITLVVPFAPGGLADIVARAVAEPMSRSLGQAIVIDNRPSAGSIVASSLVAKAAPDGYTLLLMSNSNAVSASLFRKLPYDTRRDFAPISTLAVFDLGLLVAQDSRFTDLAAVLADARAKPGRLTIGTIAVGSTQHLAAELFKTTTGIDALIVPYRGTPAVLTALRSGEIDLAFEILAPALPQVAGQALRVLAVTSAQRNLALPGVPTVQQAGVPGYDVASWNALAAPAGTPAAVIERLNAAARAALDDAALRERLRALGVRTAPGSPSQQQALLDAETQRWARVIRAANIEPQ